MRVIIGELNVELTLAHEFRQIVTYIESDYSRKSKEIGVNYAANHVFDEEQSVRWNREKVEAENAIKSQMRDKLRLERKLRYDAMYQYLKLYIEDYLELPEVSTSFVDIVREYLRNHHDSDWPCALDSLLDVISQFQKEVTNK